MKLWRPISIIALACVILFSTCLSLPASALTAAEQKKLDELNAQSRELGNKINELQGQVNNLNAKAAELAAQAATIENQIAVLQNQQAKLKAEIELEQAEYEQILQDEKYVLAPVRNYLKDRGKDFIVRFCTGIYVLMPDDYKDINVDKMLDYARIAERKVRETKKEGFEFYNPTQWDRGKQSAGIVSRLPAAVESGEIQVWYQPQVNYKTGKITGAEALCRWNSKKNGNISPGEFIPILEETGLIYDLDCHVWDTVCKDLRRWNEQGRDICVSVNLSRQDIVKNPDVAEHFNTLKEFYNLSPKQLRIEITESAYVENSDVIIKTTTKLREAGFEVEMDDFGSGYSSLNMLKEVVLDRIKLDLRFITGSGDQKMGRTILSYMVQMLQAIGTSLIAEGVETLEQADFLGSLGCEEMQGYYFYKPMPVDEFEKLDGFVKKSEKQ